MKTQAIHAANIDFGNTGDPDTLRADGDRALTDAEQVFLLGNGLPARWRGRDRYTVLEAGFGLGINFLATWAAWRADPARCERLYHVAVERQPLRREDLQRALSASPLAGLAAELLAAWPPLTPNLHALDFDGGRVRLLLAFGEATRLLPALRLRADAIFVGNEAAAPASSQLHLLKALGRKAETGATLVSSGTGRELHAGLQTAGFEPRIASATDHAGDPRDFTLAHWAPRHGVRRAIDATTTPAPRTAIVIGAGVAGAAAALALARLGLEVTVLDRHAEPASETSGNPAGLFHGTLDADDGPYARLFRSAAQTAQRDFRARLPADESWGAARGLLRVAPEAGGVAAMQALLDRLGLPPDYVQALDAGAAAAVSGVPLGTPAWFYPGGGWISPPRWVRSALAEPGITTRGGVSVGRIERLDRIAGDPGAWRVRDDGHAVVAQAEVLVLACSASTLRLLQPWLDVPWPLRASLGQVSFWSHGDEADRDTSPLRMPLAGDGYAIPLPRGGVVCGATRIDAALSAMDQCAPVTAAAHDENLHRLARLCSIRAPHQADAMQGRAGWRLHTDDRLPIAGALPLREFAAGTRLDQARLLPREPGLFVLTALGARGLTLAPLLGRLVAAQATGTPWPLEQDLADAVDPARWRVRAARATGSSGDQPG